MRGIVRGCVSWRCQDKKRNDGKETGQKHAGNLGGWQQEMLVCLNMANSLCGRLLESSPLANMIFLPSPLGTMNWDVGAEIADILHEESAMPFIRRKCTTSRDRSYIGVTDVLHPTLSYTALSLMTSQSYFSK